MRYAGFIEAADRLLILSYTHIRRNSRRLTHLLITLLPLMALLVGSCKTEQIPWAYGSNAGPEKFRTALFPDRVNYHGADYYPAAGYVARAQTFIVGQPQSLTMLTRQEIGYMFGRPALRRQDADAEIWQYKAGGCVVDFYFYGQEELAHVDVRLKSDLIPGGAPRREPVSVPEQSGCLQSLADGHGFFSSRA